MASRWSWRRADDVDGGLIMLPDDRDHVRYAAVAHFSGFSLKIYWSQARVLRKMLADERAELSANVGGKMSAKRWCCEADSSISHSCRWSSGSQETELTHLNSLSLNALSYGVPRILESRGIAGSVGQASANRRGNVLDYVGRMVGLTIYIHRPVIGFKVGVEAFLWQIQRHIKKVHDFQIDLNCDVQAKVLEYFDLSPSLSGRPYFQAFPRVHQGRRPFTVQCFRPVYALTPAVPWTGSPFFFSNFFPIFRCFGYSSTLCFCQSFRIFRNSSCFFRPCRPFQIFSILSNFLNSFWFFWSCRSFRIFRFSSSFSNFLIHKHAFFIAYFDGFPFFYSISNFMLVLPLPSNFFHPLLTH